MLNNQKIKKMHKLALYEAGEGKKHLAISNYYRSDYLGVQLIKNFFLTTIAYGLILLAYFGYRMEYYMENINKINILLLVGLSAGGYLLLLLFYSGLTYIYCSVKYKKAHRRIQEYNQGLAQMKKLYDREERRNDRLTGRRG